MGAEVATQPVRIGARRRHLREFLGVQLRFVVTPASAQNRREREQRR
jgi:hypothetical protein